MLHCRSIFLGHLLSHLPSVYRFFVVIEPTVQEASMSLLRVSLVSAILLLSSQDCSKSNLTPMNHTKLFNYRNIISKPHSQLYTFNSSSQSQGISVVLSSNPIYPSTFSISSSLNVPSRLLLLSPSPKLCSLRAPARKHQRKPLLKRASHRLIRRTEMPAS